jgi:hypothetical protein
VSHISRCMMVGLLNVLHASAGKIDRHFFTERKDAIFLPTTNNSPDYYNKQRTCENNKVGTVTISKDKTRAYTKCLYMSM